MLTDSEFRNRVVIARLHEMFTSAPFFDITSLRSMIDMLEQPELLSTRSFKSLRALHCISWSGMDPQLREAVQERCLQLFNVDREAADAYLREREPWYKQMLSRK